MFERMKQRITAASIKKSVKDMQDFLEAFDKDVKDVPCKEGSCPNCADCRQRAAELSAAVRRHFAIYTRLEEKKP